MSKNYPGLVDHNGRPIRVTRLKKEFAAPQMMGVRNPWFSSVANSLTPAYLASVFQSLEGNDIIPYLTLAEEMEERDLHYRSVLSTRKLAVAGLDVVVEAVTDEAKDVKIAEFVEDVVKADAMRPLILDLLDGLAKGFSVVEITWKRGSEWVPERYDWRDPRFFQFDRDTGSEIRVRDMDAPIDGLPLEPYKFIVHRPHLKTGIPIRSGLARLAATAYMCKSYTLKDWLAFVEVFGMPLRIGKYDETASQEDITTLLQAVARIGIDASAVIPKSMEIQFLESGGGSRVAMNDKLFSGFADYIDSQVSKGVLGQTMTTDDGSSQSQATVHNDVRTDIMVSDADQLGATLRRDLVKPLVDLNFPGPHKKYPVLRFDTEEPEDLITLSQALPPFIKLGLRVEQSVIRDRFGLDEPADDAEILGTPKQQPSDVPPKDEPGDTKKDEPAQGPDAIDDDDQADQTRQRRPLHKALYNAILHDLNSGKELSPQQELFLELNMFAENPDDDSIDRIVDQHAKSWDPIMDQVLLPVLAAVESADDYNDLQKKLKKAMKQIDTTKFVKDLATAMFKARGLGDTTDKP